MEKIYIDTAKILKAISDPKRLKIVDMLSCRQEYFLFPQSRSLKGIPHHYGRDFQK